MPYFGASPSSELANLDINGQKLILDADADTSITSDTDDQIDVEISGADDFRFTANTLTALSGSTIAANTIAETTAGSGVTIDGLLIKDTTAAFADGAVTTPSITNTGDLNTGVYFPAADTVGVTAGGTEQFRFGSNPIPGGGKNLLINGSMAIAQRSTQTGQGGSSAYSACDRWFVLSEGSPQGRVTTTQTADTNMNLNGHEYTLKVDCTTAESAVGAAEGIVIQQKIEGHNLQGLKYGTANAEEVTLSFWFSSPKTGIHCAGIYLSDTAYSQVKEFTIASANTWEYFSLTFSANTSNKINNDTGSGMIVSFPLVAGSNFQVTADQWASGDDFTTSNQQNLLDNTANNVSLAGVQLEIGSVATSFAYEDIGTTLQKCRRYFERIGPDEGSEEGIVGAGMAYGATTGFIVINYIEKRALPTISVGDATKFYVQTSGSSLATSAVSGSRGSRDKSGLSITFGSGATADEAIHMRNKGGESSGYIDINSEL